MGRSQDCGLGRAAGSGRVRRRGGFTLIEVIIVMMIGGVLLALTADGMRALNRQQRDERLSRQVLWEVTLARSYALRGGVPMALIADETNRQITVRDAFGTVYRTAEFGPTTDFGAVMLDVGTPGDSLAFSSRGMCVNCAADGTTTVTVQAAGRAVTKMFVTVLGRAELERFSRT